MRLNNTTGEPLDLGKTAVETSIPKAAGRMHACSRTTFVSGLPETQRKEASAVQLLGRTHVLDVVNHLGGDVVQGLLHNFPQ